MEFHVLLVEDDRVTLKTVEQLLRKCNYKVTCAANGREAIKVLTSCRQNGEKVDLILTDILMPEVTGFDLIHEVVHGDVFCDVPVVVMSSQDSQESVLQAFQAGAADYLIKPIRKNELATLWQHVWRANKAKGSGSGTTNIAGGCYHPGTRDGPPAIVAKAGGNEHQKHNSGGSSGGSSGAAASVLQSTGGTMVPTRAATVRQLWATTTPSVPGAGEQSGDVAMVEAQGPSARQLQLPCGMRTAVAPIAQGTSAAAGPLLAVSGAAAAATPVHGSHAALGPRPPFGPFSTSVAVHFDLNPAPGGSRRQVDADADAATGPLGRPYCAETADATTPHRAAGTSATVISWSHLDPAEMDVAMAEAEPAEDAEDADVAADDEEVAAAGHNVDDGGDQGGDPPRKRPRLQDGGAKGPSQLAAATEAAAAAASGVTAAARPAAVAALRLLSAHAGSANGGSACHLMAAEVSQGSRAASASAGLGGGARESTATPSGDTFAESPSAYTATATTSTTTTTTTTGAGSEADDQQQQQHQNADDAQASAGREQSPEDGNQAAGPSANYGKAANGTAVEEEVGTAAAAPGGALQTGRPYGSGSNARCTATSSGLGPSANPLTSAGDARQAGVAVGAGGSGPLAKAAELSAGASDSAAGPPAAGAAPAAPHSLPHPAATAPGAALPGGAVALPQGLRELAALGAMRHQELWTQRALMHQQQQQRMEAASRAASVSGSAAGPATKHSSDIGAAMGSGIGAGGAGQTGSAVSAAGDTPVVELTVLSGAGTSVRQEPVTAAVAANGTTVGYHLRLDTAQESAKAVAGSGGAGGSGSSGSEPRRGPTGAPAGAQAGGGSATSGPSLPAATNSLSLLRHSDRSAFTAFTVFLPSKVAAAASGTARPQVLPPAPQAAPMFNHPAAAAAAGSGGAVRYPQYAQAHVASLPPPPTSVSILPPMLPLHVGAAAQQRSVSAAPRPSDGAPSAGANGALRPATAAAAAAAMAAAVAAQMPFAAMQQRGGPTTLAFGPAPPGTIVGGMSGGPPPVCIPESVLQLIAHLSGRAAAELPVPETVTAAPVVVQKAPSAARLAAVAKYLEKRKHRNFQKKVRYESRKRLAEARPRLRGQFVKATVAPGAASAVNGGAAPGGAAVSVLATGTTTASVVLAAGPLLHGLDAQRSAAAAAAAAGLPTAAVLRPDGVLPSRSAAGCPAADLPDQDVEVDEDGAEPEGDSDESAAEP